MKKYYTKDYIKLMVMIKPQKDIDINLKNVSTIMYQE